MAKIRDLSKEKFGRLQPIAPTNERKNKSIVWECLCDCGNIKKIPGYYLMGGGVNSCGCLKKETDRAPKGNVIDLVGQKFNKLCVIERSGSDKRGEALWKCECECGNIITVLGSNLRTGHTTSCGCERRSRGELKIAQILNENNISFEQEVVLFKFPNKRNAKFDFYVNQEYVIEYDGETHYKYNLHGWHNEEQLCAQKNRDMIKNKWCFDNNIPIIRIPYYIFDSLTIEDLRLETSRFVVKNEI